MNQTTKKRSIQKRLPVDVVNWLRQLYSINPYPDRFHYGNMALHCKTDVARVKSWFANRRASDFRRGNLCRTCRYFKSPLATDKLHRLYPNSRHCVLLTMSDNLLHNLINDNGTKLPHSTPLSTNIEADVARNEQPTSTCFSAQRLCFTALSEQCSHNYHQQLACSQAAISYQKQDEQQFCGRMPHQLPCSTQVFQRQHLHHIDECIPSTSIQENTADYNGCSTISSCDRNRSPRNDGSSSLSSQIVPHAWKPNASTSATKLGENEFVQESSLLNVDMLSKDYSQIIYPDYMDFPHFPFTSDNVNHKQF